MIVPVILAGGSGSRLWPASRSLYPKQFLNLTDNDFSLFQQTLKRLKGIQNLADPIIVCNQEHRFLVAEQLRLINQDVQKIILEPFGKNTAPAITLAAVCNEIENATLLILPADHLVGQPLQLHQAIDNAESLCAKNKLITFGIKPSHPETGYGYISVGKSINDSSGFEIDSFVEKPNLPKAKSFIESGNYLWNSGMFAFKAEVYLDEINKYSPNILNTIKRSVDKAKIDSNFIHINEVEFEKCPSDSIDYAVMEKTDKAAVIPLDANWSDIGSWDSLWKVNTKDENNNNIKGDVYTENTSNCLVHSDSRLIATIGLDNHIVIETADAVLVANKDESQSVKKIVEKIKLQNRNEYQHHQKIYRPWGWYESICISERFQVKRIGVNPGSSLSLQMHHHRAEHWVIVKGTAEVTNGNDVNIYCEDQSTYIPLGNKHRLRNPGAIPLEIIEVQTGSYLGEDDIVRFEDNYGRES